ncbi:peptide deformylase [Eubacterium ruminantium]|uniref:Peptide deformylase n=1 Tax=Eubacterium ruminantium TaxID=42322 RepID=A0A1T4MML2_9FIRM|nr:peptide deformylase [Eubacterium ruminantium]SCW48931.1 peptide deformylase [Eubacterium ruminantium]SDM58884.1 peptide deformylase [Eubacterium ruminantium]SJZ68077.1 peptide deformylase [Eubacterium ruminantium]
MAIRNIRVDGDEILRKKCKPVTKMNERTRELIDDMFDTMYESNGVGLAAPQVGVLKRIVVIDVMDDNPLVLINPEIISSEGEQTGDEGCLSLPGLAGEVTRPMKVVCKAFDEEMNEFTVEGEGLLARCICHELDHLDGILYKDKVIDGLHRVDLPTEEDDSGEEPEEDLDEE